MGPGTWDEVEISPGP